MNHSATINAVGHFITGKMIEMDRKYVWMARQAGSMMAADAKSLREQFQYGTDVSVNSTVLADLRRNATECVEAVQVCLERL